MTRIMNFNQFLKENKDASDKIGDYQFNKFSADEMAELNNEGGFEYTSAIFKNGEMTKEPSVGSNLTAKITSLVTSKDEKFSGWVSVVVTGDSNAETIVTSWLSSRENIVAKKKVGTCINGGKEYDVSIVMVAAGPEKQDASKEEEKEDTPKEAAKKEAPNEDWARLAIANSNMIDDVYVNENRASMTERDWSNYKEICAQLNALSGTIGIDKLFDKIESGDVTLSLDKAKQLIVFDTNSGWSAEASVTIEGNTVVMPPKWIDIRDDKSINEGVDPGVFWFKLLNDGENAFFKDCTKEEKKILQRRLKRKTHKSGLFLTLLLSLFFIF